MVSCLQIDINLGSSGVVRGVMGLVFGYISALVVDMAFFIRVCPYHQFLVKTPFTLLSGASQLARLLIVFRLSYFQSIV